ncbi:MAG: ABC-F family ATP-binding cassette domain-containing protein [Bacillota bacterium]
MIIIQGINLSKSYGVENIFQNISLVVRQGEKIGLVGPNGIGKTTLLKCLAGVEAPDEGTLVLGKNLRLGYLPQANILVEGDRPLIDYVIEEYEDLLQLRQEINCLQSKMSLPEIYNDSEKLEQVMAAYAQALECYEREGGYSFESKVKGILIGLSFEETDFNRKLTTFSGGQKTRIALAKILLRSPDLLLLDEPTNYLDLKSVEWLESYLQGYPGAILAVSHDRYFLDQVTKTTFELNRSGLDAYSGNYSRYLLLKAQREEAYKRQYEKQQDFIKKQEEYIRKYKAGIKAKQARGRQTILNRLERLSRPEDAGKKADISFGIENGTGEKVLEVQGLSMEHPGKCLFNGLCFTLWKGEKVALIGDNGTGKTTLLKILSGRLGSRGDVKLGSRVQLAYFTQEHEDLNAEKTVLEELWVNPKMTEYEVRSVLGRFLFSGEDVNKKVKALSGGERSRLMLAKLFLQNANFLILDEPTNHLDVETREALEEALLDFPGNILFVSHDRYFINRLASKVLELENGKLTEYLGDFDYYKWKKKENELDEEAKKHKEQVGAQPKNPPLSEKKEKKQKELTLEDLENEIEDLEDRLHSLALVLGQEELYSNPDDVMRCTKEYHETEDRLKDLYKKWDEIILRFS